MPLFSYPWKQTGRGYFIVYIGGKRFYLHRLVWTQFKNRYIKKGFCIDHIDGNKLNNSICNLQEITVGENTRLYYERKKKMNVPKDAIDFKIIEDMLENAWKHPQVKKNWEEFNKS